MATLSDKYTLNSVSTRKKIAVVSDAVYPFNKGGKEKRIYDITRRFAAQGYDVTIYCMKWWDGERTIVRDGVTFYAISPYYALYAHHRRSIRQALFFALHCLKLITKKFDIIEVDHMPHLVLFTVKIVCLLKQKKLIVVWHEVWGSAYWQRYLGIAGSLAYQIEKISAQLPDTVISISDHTTRNLKSILKRTKKIVTIPNGLDVESIIRNIPLESGADIIFAGRLLPHKNIDVLLSAIGILVTTDPDISAFIIGEGPEKERLQALTSELRLQNNITFLDFYEDHNDLYRLMGASRVFVLPSTREGFGITALEANACGLPVIAIDHEFNAARELIKDGENGILINLDETKLAHAIEDALNFKKPRIFYRRYAEKYSWDSIVSRLQNVYLG